MLSTIATLLMFLVILFLPRLLILATQRVPFLNTLGSVFLCYAAGLLLGPLFRLGDADLATASDFSSVLVCVAMPLILFSANLPALRKLARPMLVSFAMVTAAVTLVASGSYFVFRGLVPDASDIGGMLIGTYTGGTPNMFAIGSALGSPQGRILLLQTADMIGGGLYFFLLLSILPRILKKVLPAYAPVAAAIPGSQAQTDRYVDEFSGKKRSVRPFKAFLSQVRLVLLAVGCFAVAALVALLLPSRFGNAGLAKMGEFTAVIMLVVTTLGIALSFVPKIRNAHGSYSSGQYFILMFSVVMGLAFDIDAIQGALGLLGMLLVIQFGTVLLHIGMAKLGRIDYQTMLITSTAGVFGPAFIVPVARALKNDEIVLPGILCGILGYAIGNYLGISVGNLLALIG